MSPDSVKTVAQDETSRVGDIAELLRRLCLAEANITMYSATHPVAERFIKSAYEWLSELLSKRNAPVVISAAGNRFVLDGLPMEARNPMVAKFAQRFCEIHINTLFFQPGMTYEEFESFNAILGKGTQKIIAEGGFAELMKQAGMTNIVLRDMSYVMVRADERIVSKTAQVVEGAILDKTSADTAIVNALVKEVLKKTEEQKWLLTETKNNPKGMAEQIVKGMEIALSRAESGDGTQEDALHALLDNIRLVGVGLVDQSDAGSTAAAPVLEQAVLTLEKEIRLRSQRLTTSKAAAGFINEVMSVITSFSDRVKSKQISQEFVHGEFGMKKAEKLLRTVVARTESPKMFLDRVRDELIRGGMNKETIDKLAREVDEGEKKHAVRLRKPRPPSADVQAGVAEQVKSLGIDDAILPAIVEKMSAMVEKKVKEKERQYRHEIDDLSHKVAVRNAIVESIESGILLWDEEGKVDFINSAAAKVFQTESGTPLALNLLEEIGRQTFPVRDAETAYSAAHGWTDSDRRLLGAIADTVKDKKGFVTGVIMRG